MNHGIGMSFSPKKDFTFPFLISLVCLLPLFLTPVLPSIDFYAHIVRYNVLAHPTADIENYAPHWALLPNLGMDLIGTLVLMILPPLHAAKLLAALVILAPVLGTMRLSYAIHGQVSAITALMAGILAYNLILFWGFANFLLGLGFALWSIGWWISMRHHPRWQLVGMALAGIIILFIHGLVFALWGLLLAAVELGLAQSEGRANLRDMALRWARLLALAVLPAVLFLQMQTVEAEAGASGSFSNLAEIATHSNRSVLHQRLWNEAIKRVDSILRVVETLNPTTDRIFGTFLWSILAIGIYTGNFCFDKRLIPSAFLCFLLIFIMPPSLFGVGHLDERAPLLFLAIVLSGISVNSINNARSLIAIPVILFSIHILMVSSSFLKIGKVYHSFLNIIDNTDTGHISSPIFLGKTSSRDGGLRCKPLSFLLQTENNTAVPTFAHSTQQPLRIVGPLAQSMSKIGGNYTRIGDEVSKQFSAGFDTVLACIDMPAPDIIGARLLARGEGWAIYKNTHGSKSGTVFQDSKVN